MYRLHQDQPLLWRSHGRAQIGLSSPLVLRGIDRCRADLLDALREGAAWETLARICESHRRGERDIIDLLAALHGRWSITDGYAPDPLPSATVLVIGDGPLSEATEHIMLEWGCRVARSDVVEEARRLERERARPGTHASARRMDVCPDLVVLAHPAGMMPEHWQHWLGRGIPHLPLCARPDGTVAVGPLVQPGDSPCLGCANLHSSETWDDWPLLAHQLAATRERLLPSVCWTAAARAAELVVRSITHTRVDVGAWWVVGNDGTSARSALPHTDCLCAGHLGSIQAGDLVQEP